MRPLAAALPTPGAVVRARYASGHLVTGVLEDIVTTGEVPTHLLVRRVEDHDRGEVTVVRRLLSIPEIQHLSWDVKATPADVAPGAVRFRSTATPTRALEVA